MSSLGSLVVTLAANTAAFATDLGKAARDAEKRMKEIEQSAVKVGQAIGVMAAAAVTGLVVITKQSINAADEMSKLAQKAGIGIGPLSELAFAANLSGVNTQQLAVALRGLNRNLEDASDGTGNAARAFAAMGISVKDGITGNLKNADQILAEVADKFAKYEDGAQKSALAMMIFGKAGADMIPLLNQGAKGLAEAREEARELGLTLDTETGRAAEQFNDNLTRLAKAKQGLGNAIMRELLPSLNAVTDQFVAAAKNTQIMQDTAKAAAAGLRVLATAGIIVYAAFKTVGEVLGDVAAALVMFGQGQYKQAWRILVEGGANAAQNVANAVGTIKNVWDETANSINATADDTGKKLAAPAVSAANLAKKEFEAMKAAIMAVYDDAIATIDADNQIIQNRIKEIQEQNKLAERAQTGDSSFFGEDGSVFSGGMQRPMEEALQRRKFLEELKTELQTDEQNEIDAFNRRIERINQMTDFELEAIGGRQAVIEQMERMHEDRLTEIRKKGSKQRAGFQQLDLDSAGFFFGKMSALMNVKNRELFEIGKAGAIAEAVINTYKAAVGAYSAMASIPYVGPALGAAAAAAAIAFGFAQVSAIRATTFGGGSAAGAGGAAAVVAANPTTGLPEGTPGGDVGRTPAPQSTTIVLKGDFFTEKQVRELLTKVFEVQRGGGLRFE